MSESFDKSVNQRKLRWGVLSAARINRRTIPGFQAAYNAEVIAIASRDPQKGRDAAAQWNIGKVYEGYEALLADPEIEAVYIPLPNGLHTEWVIKAAQAGKHVLCEKPLALTPEEVERIAEAAQTNQVQIMEGFMYRYHPQQARVRELLTAGAIGEPRILRGTFAFSISTPGYNIRLDDKLGGGATWDVGCYAVNISRWLFGSEPQTVYAQAEMQNGVDISAVVILDFGEGRKAVLDYGMNYGRRSFYEMVGTGGTVSVENMWQEPEVPGYVYLRSNQTGLTTETYPLTNHFQLQAEAFSQAVLTGQPTPYPLTDSAANVRVCLAIQEAIKTGQVVKIHGI